jgi:murein DD-endopeptidase MepM/ murein hydrolase activator NlpD
VDLDDIGGGDEVVAAAPGIVYLHDDGAGGFGKHINIKHDDTYFTIYGHLSVYKVQNEQFVERGQVLGLTGCTGNCSGEHLHWGLHTGNPKISGSSSTSVTANNILTSDATTNSNYRLFSSDEFVGSLSSGHFYRSNNKSCNGGYSESFRTQSCSLPVHPEGTAIRTRSDVNGTVYILRRNDAHMTALHRDGIPTEQTLWTLYQNGGLGLQDVIAVEDGEINSYPIGGTICQSGCSIKSPLPGNGKNEPPGRLITNGSEVSIVQGDGSRRPFSSQMTFSQMGYLFCNVKPVSEYASYAGGQVVDGNPEDSGGAADELGPQLVINNPSNGQTVNSNSITVSGTASDAGRGESGIFQVLVNGVRANNDTASGGDTAAWNRTITLNQGSNTITVTARDGSPGQNSTAQSISVFYQAPVSDTTGPSLSITSHSDNQTVTTSNITLAGTATDAGTGNNGISSVTINGVRASADTASGSATSNWSQTVTLNSGANNITVVAKDGSANQNATTRSITINRASASAPAVTTTAANTITTSTATLTGSINPKGAATSAWFEFGTGNTLATYNTTASQSVGAGNADINLSANLSGLTPDTVYYFRAAASNSAGTSRGAIQSFTTQAAAPPSAQDTVWMEDSIPAGAFGYGNGETWTWINNNPTPYSGSLAHQSSLAAGLHNHYFNAATATLKINSGDKLFAYVFIDPNNLPDELMLQWYDGSGWRNAYWGADQITSVGARTFMGALPAAGQWVRLEVAASLLGLEGKTLSGMAFNAWNGRVTWDRAGKTVARGRPQGL